jgi:hypothetical protein
MQLQYALTHGCNVRWGEYFIVLRPFSEDIALEWEGTLSNRNTDFWGNAFSLVILNYWNKPSMELISKNVCIYLCPFWL